MAPRKPDFFCIGAQKAGTCWLRENLRQHPQVWLPPIPELHYFDEPLGDVIRPPGRAIERAAHGHWWHDVITRQQRLAASGDLRSAAWWAAHDFLDHGDLWYRSLFGFAPEGHITGDITPRYMLCGTEEIAHMHAIAPDAKILFLLRNPIDRFWSQCRMKYEAGTLAPGEPAAMRLLDSPNGRPRGIYSQAILRFCEKFAPAQMMIVFFEAIQQQPMAVMQAVCEFLGLPDVPFPPGTLAQPVNQSKSQDAMPARLRTRVEATYRSEVELLADALGGPAANWLAESPPQEGSSMIRLTPSHVETLKNRSRAPRRQAHSSGRIFCVSMQRSGTTSVGDWLEAHGLRRAGSPTSVRMGWTRFWWQGNHDVIFESQEFLDAEILEDDPWWCPGVYRMVAERFPDARFILLERDEDTWFDSMCRHSGGRNPGWTDVHARIYQREDEWNELSLHNPNLQGGSWGLLSITEHRAHYQSIYRNHGKEVRNYFADQPGRLYHGRLDDPSVFPRMCDFAGLRHNPAIAIPRSNALDPAITHGTADTGKAVAP
jgi:hypothetical protein